jgi:hypothetical protein
MSCGQEGTTMQGKVIAGALVMLALGCSTGGGGMQHGSGTETRLDRANFRIVKARARGEDRGFYLLGFLPIVSPSVGEATDQLLGGVNSEGRAVSLANVTQEWRSWYFVLFSLPRVVVRADVIEFIEDTAATDGAPKAPAPAVGRRPPVTLAPPASMTPRR